MDLNYNHRISDRVLREMERLARAAGLPLHVIELLGQEGAVARAFIRAARRDESESFLDRLDLHRLESLLTAREEGDGSPTGATAVDLPGILPVN